jgi:hypothetical protein
VNADGSLTALEIEAGTPSGNVNDNMNANQNDNANDNQNANQNDNVNENINANSNENENENSNENENENANDNGFEDEDKFEFKGAVQTMLPDMWVIGGITVAISPETSFSTIAVGDKLKSCFVLPGGS